MRNLYLKSGYLNVEKTLSYKMPYVFIIGGRGTGKTYGFLEYLIKQKIKFILIRRTQKQADFIGSAETNPFKAVNTDHHWIIEPDTVQKDLYGFYDREDDTNIPIGYAAALSTFSNLRGIDFSDVDLVLYDEFIPEPSERPIKNEAFALFNLLETVGRNRELSGKDPLQFVALANSNRLANPVLIALKLVTSVEGMKTRGEEFMFLPEKGVAFFMLENSAISKRKKETALYRLTAGTGFAEMATGNDFVFEDRSLVGSRPLQEYKPLCTVGELTIYKHKSSDLYYITPHRSGTPDVYGVTEVDLTRWYKKHGIKIYAKYLQRKIVFETYMCEILLQNYLK